MLLLQQKLPDFIELFKKKKKKSALCYIADNY